MKGRILVIDDEPEIRRSVRMILEYEGYDVQEASSGPEGVALVEREPPDLVFLDIKMGGMDGLEALQKIRQSNEALPVVIISGHGTVSTAVEATKLGAIDSRTRARRGESPTIWYRFSASRRNDRFSVFSRRVSSAFLTVTSTRSRSSGFSMKSNAPSLVASTAVETVPCPEITTTGVTSTT